MTIFRALRTLAVFLALISFGFANAAKLQDDQLVVALESGDLAGVTKAIKQGATVSNLLGYPLDPSIRKSPFQWLLAYSVSDEDPGVMETKRLEIAKLLFSKGAKLSGHPDELYATIAYGHERVLRLLLDRGASPTEKIYGYTPMQLAYRHQQPKLQELLLARGGSPISERDRLQIDIVRGAIEWDLAVIQNSLRAGGDINAPDPSGETGLTALLSMPLISRNSSRTSTNIDLLGKFLTEWKANPAKGSETDKPTFPILQWVQMNSFLEEDFELSAQILDEIIRRGASVHTVGKFKETALHIASERGNIPACRVLLKAGAKPSATDFQDRTPMSVAKNAATRTILRAHLSYARAEKFVEISRGTIRDDVTLFDVDSPKMNPATKGVEFKYRTISDSVIGSGKTTLEYNAVAWCSQMSMWVLRVDGVGAGYKFPVKEYYKEGKGWLEYPHIAVANFSEPNGKLIAAACDAGQPSSMDELMQPSPNIDCLSPKDTFTKTLCTTSSDMRGDMALLERRIDSIGQKCGNKPHLLKALASRSENLKYCYGGDKCVWRQLSDLIFAVNDDIRELEKWESSGSQLPFPIGTICNVEVKLKKSELEKQARNTRHEAVSKSTDAFFSCAKKNIAKLDDKRSDAAVIAKVVYRPCSKEFYDVQDAREERDGKADSDELKKNFEDRLIEMILTNRSSSGSAK